MRHFVLVLALVALATEAPAADYEVPVLPGSSPDVPSPYVPAPPVYTSWGGFYAGAQAGFSRAGVDFSTSLDPLISGILRDLTILPDVLNFRVLAMKDDTGSYNVGGFAGFNTQWDDAVFGFEVSYGHTNLNKVAADSESRRFINNGQAQPNHTLQYDVTVKGSASVQITDIWTGRFRAGWAVGGFMPYGFVGGAVALANVIRSVDIEGEITDIPPPPATPPPRIPFGGSVTLAQNNAFTFGYTAGGGADYMLTPAIFVRGEWEYIGFRDVKNARVNINTLRTGLGVRF
jgi:opacity protein-like surface antigen